MSAAPTLLYKQIRARNGISALSLRHALMVGVAQVLAERDLINRMNVFPVPDGDTGSNLCFTLLSVRDSLCATRDKHVGNLLRGVASASVDGARGNSGAILAQYLHGLSESLIDASRLDLSSLAEAANLGAVQARQAIAQPVEGTMLSVMVAFSTSLRECGAQGVHDLHAGFTRALAASREALANTPRQLAVLRKAGVVDAGAHGFVSLLEGIGRYLSDRRALRESIHASVPASNQAMRTEESDAEHRWCTECVLSAVAIDRAEVRVALDRLAGSSLVMAGTREKLRIHMHVCDPALLFDTLSAFGDVRSRKADDMHAQQRATQTSTTVAIVIDSAADVPPEVFERLPLHMVSARINVGDVDYLDKVSLSSADFYALLRNSSEPVRTSQPPSGDFRRLFEFLLSHHDEIVYVGLSRSLSGTLQSGEIAAATLGPRVRVFDTGNVSGGEGLLAVHAAERARSGVDAAGIVAELETLRPHTRTFAYVRDLQSAVRGGRIPAWTLPLTRWLRLVPIAAVCNRDGRLHVRGVTIARATLASRFVRRALRGLDRKARWRAQVMHCDNPAEGLKVRAALIEQLPGVECSVLFDAGSAIGAHAGQGAVVLSLMPVLETL